jgi:hypothetical protein
MLCLEGLVQCTCDWLLVRLDGGKESDNKRNGCGGNSEKQTNENRNGNDNNSGDDKMVNERTPILPSVIQMQRLSDKEELVEIDRFSDCVLP